MLKRVLNSEILLDASGRPHSFARSVSTVKSKIKWREGREGLINYRADNFKSGARRMNDMDSKINFHCLCVIGKGLSVAITLLVKIALGLGCNLDDEELNYINNTKTSLERLRG